VESSKEKELDALLKQAASLQATIDAMSKRVEELQQQPQPRKTEPRSNGADNAPKREATANAQNTSPRQPSANENAPAPTASPRPKTRDDDDRSR
jgi:Ulp1 family protease